jgi:O-methyltransferase involved in polyketide biosynthesis
MSELHDAKEGDWLIIISTVKGSSFLLQQVTSTTTGLVRTENYTFWRNGRSFSTKQKSLTARVATATEIEQWLAKRNGQQPKRQQQNEAEQPEIILARYLASVSVQDWARLGVTQLKKIKAALEKPQQ